MSLFHKLRTAPRRLPRIPRWAYLVLFLAILESYLHWHAYLPFRPPQRLDHPFQTSCREPPSPSSPNGHPPRDDAVLVMMARNDELMAAQHTLSSLERHFNRWYRYPVIFFNDEPFDDRFVKVMTDTTRAHVSFEVIPEDVWAFPSGMDADAAQRSIQDQGARGIQHAGSEGYHHMCRFYSGQLYNLPPMRKYRWYWRLEPDTDFYCHITYDPFEEMARHGKVYGFAIALWELVETAPTLFRAASAYREAAGHGASELWKAIVDPSRVPWPLRKVLGFFAGRDWNGDAWSTCHYWSNFEIGDMDFFRGPEYQDFFRAMDESGGFFFERWGDAPVHSLGVAMLLKPSQVHHFNDIGYRHDNIWQCPANAAGGQLPGSKALGGAPWKPEVKGGVGCRCECDGSKLQRNNQPVCLDRMMASTTPGAWPLVPWARWW